MNIIGQPIKHKIFGNGIVMDLTDKIVSVSFQGGEKKFIYPDAFKTFLILDSHKSQNYVEKQIKENEDAIQKIKKIKQEEYEQRQRLYDFKVSANSHAAFNILSEQINCVFSTYSVSTGTYLSGYSKGLPRIAERIKPNSVCILTNCSKGQPEHERRIIGAFMVKEDFFGTDAPEGIIEGHSKYHLSAPTEKQMLFWEYMDQAVPSRWGNTRFKYCSANTVNRILSELVDLSGATDQRETAIEFYQYFCKINSLQSLIQFETENSPDEKH